MATKKFPNKFTLQFNPNSTLQIDAIKFLNLCSPRSKSVMVAEALYEYNQKYHVFDLDSIELNLDVATMKATTLSSPTPFVKSKETAMQNNVPTETVAKDEIIKDTKIETPASKVSNDEKDSSEDTDKSLDIDTININNNSTKEASDRKKAAALAGLSFF